MVRLLIAFGLLALAALGQSIIGQRLPLVGGRPDLPLVLVVAWAMLRGSGEGAAVGFVGGTMLDSVSYTPFGVNGALLGVLGYVTGLAETNLYRGNVPFFLGTGAVLTLGYHTAKYLVFQAFGMALPPITEAYEVAVPAALLNAVLLVPAFLACRRLVRLVSGWRQMDL